VRIEKNEGERERGRGKQFARDVEVEEVSMSGKSVMKALVTALKVCRE